MLNAVLTNSYRVACSRSARSSQHLDAELGIAASDRELAFQSASHREVGSKRIGLGARQEPVDVPFRLREIAVLQINGGRPMEHDGQRYPDRSSCSAFSTVARTRATASSGCPSIHSVRPSAMPAQL